MAEFEKYEKDGKVAVLYSPGFGAGWSTWARLEDHGEALIFDKEIVELVLNDQLDRVVQLVADKYPEFSSGGAEDLRVCWVPKGVGFRINEYDGSESVELFDAANFIIA